MTESTLPNDDPSLGFQQSLVLQQQHELFALLNEINDSLDRKAAILLQAGIFIVTLLGVLGFIGGSSILAQGLIIIGFIAFILMIGLLIAVLFPYDWSVPGPIDWDTIFNEYIFVDKDSSFNKVLSDCNKASEDAKAVNDRKSKQIKYASCLFIIQMGALLLSVVQFATKS